MHAVSDDLVTGTSCPRTPFAPDGTSRMTGAIPSSSGMRGRGVVDAAGGAHSSGPLGGGAAPRSARRRDLKSWEVREPFWTPGLYFTHECPDLFRMGDWWYLVFSKFSEAPRDPLPDEPLAGRAPG